MGHKLDNTFGRVERVDGLPWMENSPRSRVTPAPQYGGLRLNLIGLPHYRLNERRSVSIPVLFANGSARV